MRAAAIIADNGRHDKKKAPRGNGGAFIWTPAAGRRRANEGNPLCSGKPDEF